MSLLATPVRTRLVGLLVFTVSLAVYVRTMAPTVYGLDSAELTAGAYTLGIVHSPGSPAFLLIGKLFTTLPCGDIGWRVNLWSAVSAALAVAGVYALAFRLTQRIWIAAGSALLLALSYYYWVWALVAELYAPHVLFTVVTLLCIAQWRNTRKPLWLYAAAALWGLGMGNHTALALAAPGMAWLACAQLDHEWKRPTRWAPAAALALACLLGIYLYLPIRSAAHPAIDYVRDYFPHIRLDRPGGFFWMLRGGMFSALFFRRPPQDILVSGGAFLLQLIANFGLIAAVLAVYGAVRMFRHPARKVWAAGLSMIFGLHALFYISYGALDRKWMFSVCYAVWAVFAAAGWADADETFKQRRLPRARGLLAALMLLTLVRLAVVNGPKLDLSEDVSARETGLAMLNEMQPDAVYIGAWEHAPILEYLQTVEGWRPDVRTVNLSLMGRNSVRGLAHACRQRGLPVYTTVPEALADEILRFAPTRVTPLFALDYAIRD